MRKQVRKATFSLTGLLLVMALVLGACKKDEESPVVTFQTTTLSGANERPTVVNSPGTGTVNGSYNKDTKTITYTIAWSGITTNVTGMHFHNAIPTANLPATAVSGNIVIPIPGTGNPATYTSPVSGTTRTLTADEETALLAGNWYVNIHSSQFPGGELRAQVLPR
ncbi:CHRD domain-containing protein [Adhaeribacter aquaticus]|uniref:CHRD domain-containing protein n=1 Tax=Adhaeribacter aquaticus TaxID=299567 RepID=UPI00040F3A70|nr:CHRD domain-containing protein [Adhaeribacter aquaticus]